MTDVLERIRSRQRLKRRAGTLQREEWLRESYRIIWGTDVILDRLYHRLGYLGLWLKVWRHRRYVASS